MATPWNIIQNHTHLSGIYTFDICCSDNLRISTAKNYTVFIGSNPEVSISNPDRNSICINNQLTFRILEMAKNPPSTIYKVVINDAAPPSDNTTTGLLLRGLIL